jgi:hypothetical protein
MRDDVKEKINRIFDLVIKNNVVVQLYICCEINMSIDGV